jgi:hypothetical protein
MHSKWDFELQKEEFNPDESNKIEIGEQECIEEVIEQPGQLSLKTYYDGKKFIRLSVGAEDKVEAPP